MIDRRRSAVTKSLGFAGYDFGMELSAERRLSSNVLGAVFLGVLMCSIGFMAQGEQQPVPVIVWRALGVAGAVLALGTLPVARIRRDWARRSAGASLLVCAAGLALLLGYSVWQGRFNPFTFLLAMGVVGCGRGILFYRSFEIRALFHK